MVIILSYLSASQDYNSWRTALINVIQKFNVNPSSVSGWTGTTVTEGENTKSSDISDISNDIINTTRRISYIPNISSLDLGDYSAGHPYSLDTKTKIEAKIQEMNNVCYYDADYRMKSFYTVISK